MSGSTMPVADLAHLAHVEVLTDRYDEGSGRTICGDGRITCAIETFRTHGTQPVKP